MSAIDLGPCLCPKEVAAELGISERGVVRLMSSGQIRAFRVGKPWRTTREYITSYRRTKELERFRTDRAA